MNDKNKVLFLAVAGIILSLWLILLGFGETKKPSPQLNEKITSEEKEAKTASLLFSPENFQKKLGETITVDILLESEENLSGADLEIIYDSLLMEIKKINPGSFFSKPVELTRKITPGKAIYSLGSFIPSSGKGIFATLIFVTKKVGSPEIYFGGNTKVGGWGDEKINAILPPPGQYTIVE